MLEIASLFEILTKQSGIAYEAFDKPIEIIMGPNPSDPQNEIRFASGPANINVPINISDPLDGISRLLSLLQFEPNIPFDVQVLETDPKSGTSILVVFPQGYDLAVWKSLEEERKKKEVAEQRARYERTMNRAKLNKPPAPPVVEEEDSKPKNKRTRKKKEEKEEPELPSLSLGPSVPGTMSVVNVQPGNLGGRLQENVRDLLAPTKPQEPVKNPAPKPPEVETSNSYENVDQYVQIFDDAIQKNIIAPGSMMHGDKIISAAIELATARAMSGGPELEGAEIISVVIGNNSFHYQWKEGEVPKSLFQKEEHVPSSYWNYEYIRNPYTIRFPVRSAAKKKMGATPDKWVNANRDLILQMNRVEIPVVQKNDDTSIFILLYMGDELWYKLKEDGMYRRVSSETIVASREELNMFSNIVGTSMFEGNNKITPDTKTSSYIRNMIKVANKFSLPKLLDDDFIG